MNDLPPATRKVYWVYDRETIKLREIVKCNRQKQAISLGKASHGIAARRLETRKQGKQVRLMQDELPRTYCSSSTGVGQVVKRLGPENDEDRCFITSQQHVQFGGFSRVMHATRRRILALRPCLPEGILVCMWLILVDYGIRRSALKRTPRSIQFATLLCHIPAQKYLQVTWNQQKPEPCGYVN